MLKRVLVCGLLFFVGSASTANAGVVPANVLPTDVSFLEDSYSASWPDSPKFTARLRVSAGPEGADFTFGTSPGSWGQEQVKGLPFRSSSMKLVGPGDLRAIPAPPVLRHYGCLRGFRPDSGFTYRLKLPPDTTTTVVLSMELGAAPIPGMDESIKVRFGGGSGTEAKTVEAPVRVDGPEGIQVRFGVKGQAGRNVVVGAGKKFRIEGTTHPQLRNHRIRLKAEPRSWRGGGTVAARWITVTTDENGSFVTNQLDFKKLAIWQMTAHPAPQQGLDNGSSCGPEIATDVISRPAEMRDLAERTFRSIKIRSSEPAKPRFVKLKFGWKKSAGPPGYTDILIGTAGCNQMRGEYWIKRGRLFWSKRLASTKKGCARPVDAWLKRFLAPGVKAQIVRKRLVLSNKNGTEITLARVQR